jgi:peptidoglycan hydrolase CwlO-like protein
LEREIPEEEEEREKTIRCLLKAMDYQLMGINEKAKDLEEHNKRIERELNEFDAHLKSEENRLLLADIKRKIEKTK